MSVIVKGMQMPKACMLCPIYDREYGECGVLHDRNLFPFLSEDTYRYDATKEIHKDCPLVGRPQGEWKVNNYGEHICPICGHYALYDECQDNDYYEVQSNFCPECGADLRGKEDE